MLTTLIARLRRPRTCEGEADGLRDALAEVRAVVAALEARVAIVEQHGGQDTARRSSVPRRESAGVAALRHRVHALLASGCSQAEAARRLGITRQLIRTGSASTRAPNDR